MEIIAALITAIGTIIAALIQSGYIRLPNGTDKKHTPRRNNNEILKMVSVLKNKCLIQRLLALFCFGWTGFIIIKPILSGDVASLVDWISAIFTLILGFWLWPLISLTKKRVFALFCFGWTGFIIIRPILSGDIPSLVGWISAIFTLILGFWLWPLISLTKKRRLALLCFGWTGFVMIGFIVSGDVATLVYWMLQDVAPLVDWILGDVDVATLVYWILADVAPLVYWTSALFTLIFGFWLW